MDGVTYYVAMTTPAPLTERETLERYEKRGALLRGHFRFTSGLHSDVYLQSALVLQHPEDAGVLGEGLAAAFRDEHPQTVLAPAIGGILVAHEVARALGVRALFSEREDGVMRLRRGFTLSPGERCLVVEDVITTGGSTREVVQCVETPRRHRGRRRVADRPQRRRGGVRGEAGGAGDGDSRHLPARRLPALQGGQSGHQARQPYLTVASPTSNR